MSKSQHGLARTGSQGHPRSGAGRANAERPDRWRGLFLGLALLSTPAHPQPVRATLGLASVRLEVVWVQSASELARIRQQYERPAGDIRSRTGIGGGLDRTRGFTVLGKRNGEQVCLVYVYRPVRVDDDHTLAVGHEVLHCVLGEYHE